MDAWTPEQLLKMQAGGNGKCNAFLKQYGIEKHTDIREKYNSQAAEVGQSLARIAFAILTGCRPPTHCAPAQVGPQHDAILLSMFLQFLWVNVKRNLLHLLGNTVGSYSTQDITLKAPMVAVVQFLREKVKAEVEKRPYTPPPPSSVRSPAKLARGGRQSSNGSAGQDEWGEWGDGGSSRQVLVALDASDAMHGFENACQRYLHCLSPYQTAEHQTAEQNNRCLKAECSDGPAVKHELMTLFVSRSLPAVQRKTAGQHRQPSAAATTTARTWRLLQQRKTSSLPAAWRPMLAARRGYRPARWHSRQKPLRLSCKLLSDTDCCQPSYDIALSVFRLTKARSNMQGGKYVGFGSGGSAPPRPSSSSQGVDQVTTLLSTGWNQLSTVAGATTCPRAQACLPLTSAIPASEPCFSSCKLLGCAHTGTAVTQVRSNEEVQQTARVVAEKGKEYSTKTWGFLRGVLHPTAPIGALLYVQSAFTNLSGLHWLLSC